MKSAVYYPGEGIRIDERPVPQPGPGELLLHVAAAGICGSDMHYYRDGHIGEWWIRQPHVLGHEFSGTIVAVGDEVEGFKIGDRAVVEPIIPCSHCLPCQRGVYNLCANLRFTGSPHTDGAFQEYVIVRPRFTHLLPNDMDFELGALVEPTSVAVHALRRSQMQLGDTVLVIGAGPIGLLTLSVALASGAGKVIVSDIDPTRLEKACELGASAVINAREGNARLADLTSGRGADVVFEAVGNPKTINTSLELVKPAGRLVIIGVNPEAEIPINLMTAQSKEVDIVPVYLGRNAFPAALDLLASGRVNARAIITHVFPLTEMAAAMETAIGRQDHSIKVMVKPA